MASIFSQIIAGDIPAQFVWQDDMCVAFMTIAPIREGHVLVVPRDEINHWHDLPDTLALHLMLIAKKIAKALRAAYPAERVGMMIAGLEVPHTHVHLMPVDSMADMDFSRATMTDTALLKAAASNIVAKL
jgi:histidine triad (HIT) family protein